MFSTIFQQSTTKAVEFVPSKERGIEFWGTLVRLMLFVFTARFKLLV